MCVDTSLLEIIIPGCVRFHMRAPASVSGEENNLNPMGNGKASLNVEEKFENTTGKHLYDGGDVANMTRDLRGVASDGLATIVTQIAESSPSALNVTNGVSMSRDGTLEDGSISCTLQGPLVKSLVNDVMLTLSTAGESSAGAASLANMENASVIQVPEYSETDLSPCTPAQVQPGCIASDAAIISGGSGTEVSLDASAEAPALPKSRSTPTSVPVEQNILHLRYLEAKWLQTKHPVQEFSPPVALLKNSTTAESPESIDPADKAQATTQGTLRSMPDTYSQCGSVTEECKKTEAGLSNEDLVKLGRLMSARQRDALITALLQFGYGNWSAIESSANCLHPDYVPVPHPNKGVRIRQGLRRPRAHTRTVTQRL